ncbi:hypothetical protein [Nitrobacter winogradskyi]|uniref:Uncharacterized protein n=1 Tax=Nitrobacter winogradskyi TaxID=913 RepID=A0ACC6AI05_NITWI|nr:hypothetical protein [Nitrobacter winogradskyi]MCP1999339.1 hypothetical protein [Nitrobacter winogradskyi]
MAGLVPAIHVLICRIALEGKTWMRGGKVGMTVFALQISWMASISK